MARLPQLHASSLHLPPSSCPQRCTAEWSLVQEAEALLASLAPPGTSTLEPGTEAAAQAEQQGDEPAVGYVAQRSAIEVLHGEASCQAAVLRERLAALRGPSVAPDAVWLRASSALLSCQTAVDALPVSGLSAGAGAAEE